MFLRYSFLAMLGMASLYAVISAGAGTSRMILVDAGHMGQSPANPSLWILAALVAAPLLSLCRFVVAGLPDIVTEWCASHKEWLISFAVCGLIFGVFYLV